LSVSALLIGRQTTSKTSLKQAATALAAAANAILRLPVNLSSAHFPARQTSAKLGIADQQ
jgi:hypothetical protein